ncbi:Phytanoyl-CoA dioxygenase [Lachnellula suecica]|uniref:Phytanoyl-CoA dioxygenase n=1 Tax=Lachnellula suecica TaxID=602035 RepID=A0A8T9C5V3_9HELO|nr:Phytanoyl-CoA dioxygenase [Lachnellula suecica]
MAYPYLVNDSQLACLQGKGYAIITDALSPMEIQTLQIWTQQVHDLPRLEDCQYIPYEEVNTSGERVLCRTENFAKYHDGFGDLLMGSKLLGILKQLSGKEMVLFKEKSSGGFQPHVDRSGYGNFKTIDHLAINLAVDDSNVLNGCIEVVEGSHKMHVPIGNDNCIKPEWVQAQKWLHVELKAGDLLIFGSSLAHRSGPNLSAEGRRAVYATYNCKSEGDLHDAYYEKRARLFPATHKRMPGVDYSIGAQSYAYGTPMRSIESSDESS